MIVCKAAIIGQAADVCEHVAKRDLRCDRMLRQPAVKGVVQIEAAGGDQAEQGGRLDRLGETVKQDPAIAFERRSKAVAGYHLGFCHIAAQHRNDRAAGAAVGGLALKQFLDCRDELRVHRRTLAYPRFYYTGTRTVARRPPIGLSPRLMSPPCERAISRAIARPRPVPPSSWLRASSSRRNGLNTSSRISGGMPGPSSSTVTVR